jgi:hypothetical protein
MNERREELLQRIHERTDVLMVRTASTIHEALEEYLRERELELSRRRPHPESRRSPR